MSTQQTAPEERDQETAEEKCTRLLLCSGKKEGRPHETMAG
uniref:Uncharacterized protein n=1 Tax=Setaria viridis TaxID=4556 RepID=A0A4V6D2R1_SETVI|nr:hypothetical protein SEVIR_8G057150v2 [Setaria viridis]